MVKAGRTIALLCLGWLIMLPAGVQAQTASLEQVLAQLDTAATSF